MSTELARAESCAPRPEDTAQPRPFRVSKAMIKAHDRGMNCFVTGASGFIGANMVHELVARGHRVKALLRPGADLRGLAGADFERVEGDVSVRGRLEKSVRGCD